MTNLMRATPQGDIEMTDEEQAVFLSDQAGFTPYSPPPPELSVQLVSVLIEKNIIAASDINPTTLQDVNDTLEKTGQPEIITKTGV